MYMLNHTLADITFFYQKEPPEEVYRFLEIGKKIMGLNAE